MILAQGALLICKQARRHAIIDFAFHDFHYAISPISSMLIEIFSLRYAIMIYGACRRCHADAIFADEVLRYAR